MSMGHRHSVDTILSPGLDYSLSFTSPLAPSRSYFKSCNQTSDGANIIVQQNRSQANIVKVKPEETTARYKVCLELLDTEQNYLNLLRAIVEVFQKPLEDLNYLDATDMKTIFGNIPPLLELHESLCKELNELISKWKETNSIGQAFIKHVSYQKETP